MKDVLLGILCGMVTIPVGCFVGGLVGGVAPLTILFNLIPCLVLTVIVVVRGGTSEGTEREPQDLQRLWHFY